MNPKWSQEQFWKDRVPEPGIIAGAARDFAREASAIVSDNIPAGARRDAFRAKYERQMIDAYITGTLEMCKAITTGEFRREPWNDVVNWEPTDAYAAWFNSLPPVPMAARATEEAPTLAPMARTAQALENFRRQPCEAYGRLLFASMLNWNQMDSWAHFGQVRAVYDEMRERKFLSPNSFFPIYFWVLAAMRSRYAGTWNDYLIMRWMLRRDARWIVDLHERVHRKGKWTPAAMSAKWALDSLRQQHAEFDADYRAVVHCDACKPPAVFVIVGAPAPVGNPGVQSKGGVEQSGSSSGS